MENNMITLDQVIAVADRLIEERGEDYKYEAISDIGECTYSAPDGTPSCLVGVITAELDNGLYEWLTFTEWDDRDGMLVAESPGQVKTLYNNFAEVYTKPAVEFLQAAQYMQDNGYTWGEAIVSGRAAADKVS